MHDGAAPGDELLDRALAGDDGSVAELVERLAPVIQVRVAKALLACSRLRGDRLRAEVEDGVQEIFALLFADGARTLRSWSPERGLSLEGFVGMVAERRTISRRRGRHDEAGTADGEPWLRLATSEPDAERRTASRDRLGKVLAGMRREMSPKAREVFELLFVRQLAVAEVCRRAELTPAAVYQWRRRLRRLARRVDGEVSSATAGSGRRSRGGKR